MAKNEDQQEGEGTSKAAKPSSAGPAQRRKRTARPYPAATFEDSLLLADTIQKIGSGDPVRRLTLFDHLEKSPDSGASRQLVTNSSKYGLTNGSYKAEYIELTADGAAATSADSSPRDRLRARFKLAIEGVEPFNLLYEQYNGKKLPSQAVMRDNLRDAGIDESLTAEAVDTFVGNAKFLGLLKPISGAERLLSVEHVVDELAGDPSLPHDSFSGSDDDAEGDGEDAPRRGTPKPAAKATGDWTKICFYVTPIGDEGSEQRMHSDLFLESIVSPAVEEFGLTIVRADQIGEAGMISGQIIEHLTNAALVVADLSYHNPNVFYEVALRHAIRRPIVQIIRTLDRIPFDLDQLRTIRIDTTSIFSLVPQIETYKSEIANQTRKALQDGAEVNNPLTVFFPAFFDAVKTR